METVLDMSGGEVTIAGTSGIQKDLQQQSIPRKGTSLMNYGHVERLNREKIKRCRYGLCTLISSCQT